MSFIKAKRNQIVAIMTRHVSTDVKMKRSIYDTWRLAEVTSVDRKGIAQKWRYEPGAYEYVRSVNDYVNVISEPDKQAAARRVFDKNVGTFDDQESLKQAILAETNP